VTYGIGAQYNITPVFGVRAEYQVYSDAGDGATDVNVMSIGVIYRFK
jgi:opacity protein-like surface antigen